MIIFIINDKIENELALKTGSPFLWMLLVPLLSEQRRQHASSGKSIRIMVHRAVDTTNDRMTLWGFYVYLIGWHTVNGLVAELRSIYGVLKWREG